MNKNPSVIETSTTFVSGRGTTAELREVDTEAVMIVMIVRLTPDTERFPGILTRTVPHNEVVDPVHQVMVASARVDVAPLGAEVDVTGAVALSLRTVLVTILHLPDHTIVAGAIVLHHVLGREALARRVLEENDTGQHVIAPHQSHLLQRNPKNHQLMFARVSEVASAILPQYAAHRSAAPQEIVASATPSAFEVRRLQTSWTGTAIKGLTGP